mgnify:CR=1 FL=1
MNLEFEFRYKFRGNQNFEAENGRNRQEVEENIAQLHSTVLGGRCGPFSRRNPSHLRREMEAEAALKRAVEHWQFRRKRAAVSSLVGYTFRSTKGRALDAEAAASFRRKVAARLLRVLWLSVVQRCAYSDVSR